MFPTVDFLSGRTSCRNGQIDESPIKAQARIEVSICNVCVEEAIEHGVSFLAQSAVPQLSASSKRLSMRARCETFDPYSLNDFEA